ncbi:MAG TPA: glycosyltransferase family 4 protein [Candidatus Saccharimonadales bacterium]|nr:glycosyltransferase family 4 protein [Candidatus Saccharimonadales bacterium]
MKPKILFITQARSIGGGEVYLSSLLPGLQAKFDLVVLAKKRSLSILAGVISKHRFILFPKLLARLPRNYRLRKIYYRLYFKFIFQAKNYDLISLQDFDGALIEAINHPNVTLTLLTRFLIPEEFNAAVRQNFAKISKVICVSEQTKKDLLKRGVDEDKCAVVHNGIDVESYEPNSEPGEYITWIGRVEEADKNPLLFVKIAEAAKAQGLDYKFRIVGDGSFLPSIRLYIKARRIDNLELYGFCPPDKINLVYTEASLLCLTSTSEGIPLVALEAMACGVPVIATNVGGLPEIINNPSVGILVGNSSQNNFLEQINKIVSNPKMYQDIQAAARKHVKASFGLKTMIEKTAQIYNDCLKEQK